MAKKDEKKEIGNEEGMEPGKEDSTGSKFVSILIVFIIVIIWFAIFGVLIKLNVGNFGSDVLAPVLKDVPIINKILPSSGAESYEGQYNFSTIGEAVGRIKELEKQLSVSSDTMKTNEGKIKELQAEIARLKVFEDEKITFDERVKEFDEKVVFADQAPNIDEYKTFYEGIQPDNAAEIYKKVIEKIQYTKKIQDLADTYSRMEPALAAPQLETMTSDLDLLASIMACIQPSKRALILQNMSVEAAAQIATKMTLK